MRRAAGVVATVVVWLAMMAAVPPSAGAIPPVPGATLYLSSSSAGSVAGIGFTSGDVLAFSSGPQTWSMALDASDLGLGSANVDAVDVIDTTPGDAEVLLSFAGPTTVPGIGRVDDSDVVRLVDATLGPDTSGTFVQEIDGSDISLTAGGEDIDALALDGSRYLFSTLGTANLALGDSGTLLAADEDLTAFVPTLTGPLTTGDYASVFDGSSVGLASEDINAADFDGARQLLYGSTQSPVSIDGLTADIDDVWVFVPSAPDLSAGSFSLIFDGDEVGFVNENIDALDVAPPAQPGLEAALTITASDSDDPVFPFGFVAYNLEITNAGPDTAFDPVVTILPRDGLTVNSVFTCEQLIDNRFCQLQDLVPGGTATLLVNVLIPDGASGDVSMEFRVATSTPEADLSDNVVTETTSIVVPPVANPDGPAPGSTPGDPFHIEVGGTLIAGAGSAEDLLLNDELGLPAASIVSFGGLSLSPSVGDYNANSTAFSPDGQVKVNDNGTFTFTPSPSFDGPFSFEYRLRNPNGAQSDGTVTILVGEEASAIDNRLIYLSTTTAGTVDGIDYEPEDVLAYSPRADRWWLFLDGSDLGLGSANIDAIDIGEGFAVEEIRFSFTGPISIPGVGLVDDSDIVQFGALTLGENTSGTFFGLDLDGSDVGLRAGGEDVDAMTFFDGGVHVSTIGSGSVPTPGPGNLAVRDEDLLLRVGNEFEQALDGSDVGFLADLSSASFDAASGDLLGTSIGGFSTPDLVGDGNDIFAFSGTGGPDTAGTLSLFLDAGAAGLGAVEIDALQVVRNTNTLLEFSSCTASITSPIVLPTWFDLGCGGLFLPDDGLPVPPGNLTGLWQQLSGPTSASIVDPMAPDTMLRIVDPGSYEYRYQVTDGELVIEPSTLELDLVASAATSSCAGASFEITLPAALELDCTVDLGPGGGTPTINWFQGFRGETFSNLFVADPTVTFERPGTYLLSGVIGDGGEQGDQFGLLVSVLPAPTGAIGGRPWVDVDRDGVRDPIESSAGFLAVDVEVVGAGDDGQFDTGDDVVMNTSATFRGDWYAAGLADGDYRITFSNEADGFTQQNVGTDDTIDSDADQATGQVFITLAGASQTHIDAGYLLNEGGGGS